MKGLSSNTHTRTYIQTPTHARSCCSWILYINPMSAGSHHNALASSPSPTLAAPPLTWDQNVRTMGDHFILALSGLLIVAFSACLPQAVSMIWTGILKYMQGLGWKRSSRCCYLSLCVCWFSMFPQPYGQSSLHVCGKFNKGQEIQTRSLRGRKLFICDLQQWHSAKKNPHFLFYICLSVCRFVEGNVCRKFAQCFVKSILKTVHF